MRTTFEYELTSDQYTAALKFNQQLLLREPPVRRQMLVLQGLSLLVWFAIGIASVLLTGNGNTAGIWFPVALASGLGVIGFQQRSLQKSIFRHLAGADRRFRSPQSLAMESAGMRWTTSAGECHFAWSAIRRVEFAGELILLCLDGGAFLPVPDSAFSNPDERQAFLQVLQEQVRVQVQVSPPPPVADVSEAESVAGKGDAGTAWSGLLQNLKLGTRLVFFLRLPPGGARVSWTQFVMLAGLGAAIPSIEALFRIGLKGSFSSYALPGAVFHLPLLLVLAWAVAGLAGRSAAALQLLVVFAAMIVPVDIAYLVHFHVAGGEASWLPRAWRYYVYHVPALWLTLASIVAAIRVLDISPRRWLATASVVGVVMALPLLTVYRDRVLWVEAYDEEARADFDRRHAALTNEGAFYLQPKLLERELAALKPGRKGVIDLYFVGAAGFAGQDVFMKEVHSVAKLFQERFDTEGRSVMLINNAKSVAESPIASATSLRAALRRVGEVMDRDEDILFLFLTSHGSRDHKFSLDFWPMRFDPVDPRRLRELLDESGIKRRVIVVSACYSGGFVDALKDENSLVITAAAPDKNSFGCSNEADFTYFGKAYFDEALRKTHSFIEAFELAGPIIAAREKKEDHPGSDPRIHVGSGIRQPLDELVAQLRVDKKTAALNVRPAGAVRLSGKYDEFLDLLSFRDQIREIQKQCLAEMKLSSPSKLVETQPDYFGGLGPESSHWLQLVATHQNYAEEICFGVNSEDVYRNVYRDAWRAQLSEGEMESVLRLFKTPTGRRWLVAQHEIATETPKQIFKTRTPMIESATQRFQSGQMRIIADYQKEMGVRRRSGESAVK